MNNEEQKELDPPLEVEFDEWLGEGDDRLEELGEDFYPYTMGD